MGHGIQHHGVILNQPGRRILVLGCRSYRSPYGLAADGAVGREELGEAEVAQRVAAPQRALVLRGQRGGEADGAQGG